jgi:acyl-CoA synthetase (AMP-forming)/AMP-acid ligase II
VFLGRSDDRFKVQGQFVCPVWIERCLAAVDGIAECLVAPERDASGLPVVVARAGCANPLRWPIVRRRNARSARRLRLAHDARRDEPWLRRRRDAGRGIPDKIEDGVTGWLAEPGNADSLAAAVLRCETADEATKRRIRQAAAERCRERFDWPICVDRYLTTISRLAAGLPAAPETAPR